MKAVTRHAKDRASKRWGLELTNAGWIALSKSLVAGDHELVRQQPGGLLLYRVVFVRDDASTVSIPVLCTKGGTIVTVPPRGHFRKTKPPTRKR